jgi:hypothetical protein
LWLAFSLKLSGVVLPTVHILGNFLGGTHSEWLRIEPHNRLVSSGKYRPGSAMAQLSRVCILKKKSEIYGTHVCALVVVSHPEQ